MARSQLLAAWFVGLATLQLVYTAPTSNTAASDRAALAPVLGKTFRMEHCDNTVAALQAIGIGEPISKMAQTLTFTLMLTEDYGEYTLTSDIYMKLGNFPTKLGTSRIPFRIGQEINVMNFDGEVAKARYTQDGNTLTEFRDGKNPGTTIRIFTPEEVKTTVKVKGVTNNCVYKPE